MYFQCMSDVQGQAIMNVFAQYEGTVFKVKFIKIHQRQFAKAISSLIFNVS